MAKQSTVPQDQPQGSASIQGRLGFDALAQSGGALPDRLTQWQPSDWAVAEDWKPITQHFLSSSAGVQLGSFITQRLAQGAIVYPPQPFRALELTPLNAVQVVILGQDPYHGPNQAHGLAFSVPAGVRTPPSLKNIFKEISLSQTGRSIHGEQSQPVAVRGGSLEPWPGQGVLLLNTCLTVEQGVPACHANHGWEILTDALIQAVSHARDAVVFMLWGAHAQTKRALIAGRHLVLTANHPSPLSASRPPKPFTGCNHFELANDWLQKQGDKVISW